MPNEAARPRLSRARIWNMCCGLLGVQVVWGLQNVNTSRIFQTLGASVEGLAILWIAAPVTGLVVQPLIGHMSDRTWGPLGRRRPYLLGGALLTALALLAMSNAGTIWMASLALWLLTASINVAAEPFRRLMRCCPTRCRHTRSASTCRASRSSRAPPKRRRGRCRSTPIRGRIARGRSMRTMATASATGAGSSTVARSATRDGRGLTIRFEAADGRFVPWWKEIAVTVHGAAAAGGVSIDGRQVPASFDTAGQRLSFRFGERRGAREIVIAP